ncbi:MAG: hypothetical protein R2942_18465 [Ignavibacteria bacterium]
MEEDSGLLDMSVRNELISSDTDTAEKDFILKDNKKRKQKMKHARENRLE